MLRDVQELIVTEDMHQRKRLMFERSDAFVALPGGIGTLEELVEQLTWAQLGRHTKPIVLANIDGFWDPFLSLLTHMREEAFIRAGLEVRFVTVDRAEDIVPAAIRRRRAASRKTSPSSPRSPGISEIGSGAALALRPGERSAAGFLSDRLGRSRTAAPRDRGGR